MRAAQRITTGLVQEWIEHFLAKNQDYNSESMPGLPDGFENADVLGIPGQFGEIWRKIWKLKKGMWDRTPLTGEPVREVLLDLIGHAFLAIDMLDRQQAAADAEEADAEERDSKGKKTQAYHQRSQAYRQMAEGRCGPVCSEGHAYVGDCKLRRISNGSD